MGEDVYGTFSEVDSELLGSFAGLVPDGIDLNDIHVAGRFLPDYSAGQQSRSFSTARQPQPAFAASARTAGGCPTIVGINTMLGESTPAGKMLVPAFNSGSGSHSLYSPRQPWPTFASYPATVGTSRTTNDCTPVVRVDSMVGAGTTVGRSWDTRELRQSE